MDIFDTLKWILYYKFTVIGNVWAVSLPLVHQGRWSHWLGAQPGLPRAQVHWQKYHLWYLLRLITPRTQDQTIENGHKQCQEVPRGADSPGSGRLEAQVYSQWH